MRHLLIALLLLLSFARTAAAQPVPYPICDDPGGAAIPAGYSIAERSMPVAGATRWYCVVTPAGYSVTGPDYPIVFIFHGGGGNPQKMMANGKNFLEEGLARGYVLVFPAGLGDPDRCDPTVPCEFNYWGDDANIDFLNALIAEAARFNLDEDRIYLAGFSGGARLIYRAIETDRFTFPVAAIATAAGSLGVMKVDDPAAGLPVTNVAAGTPTDALLFQGEADTRMTFAGGLSQNDTEIQLPFAVKVDLFRILTGTTADPGTAQAFGTITGTLYSLGADEVLALSEPATAHTWPGTLTAPAFDFFDSH